MYYIYNKERDKDGRGRRINEQKEIILQLFFNNHL